jgi:hypothetical protein
VKVSWARRPRECPTKKISTVETKCKEISFISSISTPCVAYSVFEEVITTTDGRRLAEPECSLQLPLSSISLVLSREWAAETMSPNSIAPLIQCVAD